MEIARKIFFFVLDMMQTVLIAFTIFLVVYLFLFRPFQVSGESMFPTFKNQEYILTNLITLHFNELKHGDVIVFKAPSDNNKDFIKRVIGLPGDSLFIKEGLVYVNGKKLDESAYLANDVKTYGGSFLKEDQSVTVPQGAYLVMGDNRPFSSDSREWGFLQHDAVIGKSFYVYWPLTTMRIITNPHQTP